MSQMIAELYDNNGDLLGDIYIGDEPDETLPEELNVIAVIHGEDVNAKYKLVK